MRGFHFARAEAANGAAGSLFADIFGGIELGQAAGNRIPVIALHVAAFVLRDRDGGNRAIGAAIFADEAMRVGENFAAGGGVEGCAVGVLEARVKIERCFFGAAGIVDAVGAGERIDIFVIEIEIAGELSRVSRLRECRRRDLRT